MVFSILSNLYSIKRWIGNKGRLSHARISFRILSMWSKSTDKIFKYKLLIPMNRSLPSGWCININLEGYVPEESSSMLSNIIHLILLIFRHLCLLRHIILVNCGLLLIFPTKAQLGRNPDLNNFTSRGDSSICSPPCQ